MRLLIATWDGAGNLPPILALTTALAQRGHEVQILGHDVQKRPIETAGGGFIPFDSAPQWDVGVPGALGDDPVSQFLAFEQVARHDVLAVAGRLEPAAVLVDCMLPGALTAAKGAGFRTVALVHALYSFFVEFAGGVFRLPIDEADLALGLTYRAFDPQADVPSNVHFVGPARPDLGTAPWARRRSVKPFVVASLSTGVQRAGQQDLLQRVCDALAPLDVEALVTTGRGIAPESLIAGANTTVERLVPHDAVLGQADLLVTHAGHGTVMAGLRFGVCMLCLPPASDQPLNAAKVAQLGLGAVLDPSSSSAEIGDAIRGLLADKATKARARAFAAKVAGEPGVEKAVELVEALAVAADLARPARLG